MRFYKTFSSLAVALTLVACGGGSGNSGTSQTSATQPKKIKVIDSNVIGLGVQYDDGTFVYTQTDGFDNKGDIVKFFIGDEDNKYYVGQTTKAQREDGIVFIPEMLNLKNHQSQDEKVLNLSVLLLALNSNSSNESISLDRKSDTLKKVVESLKKADPENDPSNIKLTNGDVKNIDLPDEITFDENARENARKHLTGSIEKNADLKTAVEKDESNTILDYDKNEGVFVNRQLNSDCSDSVIDEQYEDEYDKALKQDGAYIIDASRCTWIDFKFNKNINKIQDVKIYKENEPNKPLEVFKGKYYSFATSEADVYNNVFNDAPNVL